MRHLMVACALLSSVLACSGSDGESQEKGAATVSAVPILDIPGTTPAARRVSCTRRERPGCRTV